MLYFDQSATTAPDESVALTVHLPADIQVENVHLSDSLMKLSYNLNRNINENGIF